MRRPLAITIAVAVAASALFIWSVRAAGPAEVAAGVRRVGPWFAVVLLLGGLRHLARAAAWRQCLDAPARLSWRSAFLAAVAGNAVGTITPLGLAASEPSKVLFAGLAVPVADLAAALAIENLFYASTAIVMVVAGMTALVVSVDAPPAVRHTLTVALGVAVAIAAALAAIAWVVGRRLAPRVGGWPATRIAAVVAIEAAYHAMAVLEIWIVVSAIAGASASFRTAFIFESVNRAVTIAFQFVPLWIGIDEAASGRAAALLQLAPAAGVSLALVRKARILCWTGAGLSMAVTRVRSRVSGSR